MPLRAEGKPHLRACPPPPKQVMSVAFQWGSANVPCAWRSRCSRLGSQPLAAGPQFFLSSPGLGFEEAAVVVDAFLVTCAHSVTLWMVPLPLHAPHPGLLTLPPHPGFHLAPHPAPFLWSSQSQWPLPPTWPSGALDAIPSPILQGDLSLPLDSPPKPHFAIDHLMVSAK